MNVFEMKVKRLLKKTNYLIAALLLGSFMLDGCRKNDFIIQEKLPKNLNELNASENFSWTTEMPVIIQITGLPTIEEVRSNLRIAMADGSIVFSGVHRMDLDTTYSVVVPSTETSLKIMYGSQSYDVGISGNQAQFSFIPE